MAPPTSVVTWVRARWKGGPKAPAGALQEASPPRGRSRRGWPGENCLPGRGQRAGGALSSFLSLGRIPWTDPETSAPPATPGHPSGLYTAPGQDPWPAWAPKPPAPGNAPPQGRRHPGRSRKEMLPHVGLFFVFFCLLIFILYWSIVDVQRCVSLRCTAEWFSYAYIFMFFFKFFSYLGYYKILSIVSCAIQ